MFDQYVPGTTISGDTRARITAYFTINTEKVRQHSFVD